MNAGSIALAALCGLGTVVVIGLFLFFWYKESKNAQAWEDDGK